jgi:hypothetical protein
MAANGQAQHNGDVTQRPRRAGRDEDQRSQHEIELIKWDRVRPWGNAEPSLEEALRAVIRRRPQAESPHSARKWSARMPVSYPIACCTKAVASAPRTPMANPITVLWVPSQRRLIGGSNLAGT